MSHPISTSLTEAVNAATASRKAIQEAADAMKAEDNAPTPLPVAGLDNGFTPPSQ